MNMNMKNEKTMLALVLVAALAMVSVAGVALASESDADSVDVSKLTIVYGDLKITSSTSDSYGVYAGDLGSTVTINADANYTGTLCFGTYDQAAKIFTPLVTLSLTGVSNAIINYNAESNVILMSVNEEGANSTGVVSGDIVISQGAIVLGATSYFTGKIAGNTVTIEAVNVMGFFVKADTTDVIGGTVSQGTMQMIDTAVTTSVSYKVAPATIDLTGTATLALDHEYTPEGETIPVYMNALTIDEDVTFTIAADSTVTGGANADIMTYTGAISFTIGNDADATIMDAALYDSDGKMVVSHGVLSSSVFTFSGTQTVNIGEKYTIEIVYTDGTTLYVYSGIVTFSAKANVTAGSETTYDVLMNFGSSASFSKLATTDLTYVDAKTISYDASVYKCLGAYAGITFQVGDYYSGTNSESGLIKFTTDLANGDKVIVLLQSKIDGKYFIYNGSLILSGTTGSFGNNDGAVVLRAAAAAGGGYIVTGGEIVKTQSIGTVVNYKSQISTVITTVASTDHVNGKIVVDGVLDLQYTSEHSNAVLTNAGTITTNGHMYYESDETIVIGGTLNAAYYTATSITTPKYTNTYTTIAKALAESDDIIIVGEHEILEDLELVSTLEGSTTTEVTFDSNSKVAIGSDLTTNLVTAIVSVPTNTTIYVNGEIDVVNGQFRIAELENDVYSGIKAAVFYVNAQYGIYTDLATALGLATTDGDVIDLRDEATLSADATLAAGVTLNANGKMIIILSETTLTVDGIIIADGGIYIQGIYISRSVTHGAGELVLNNYDKDMIISLIETGYTVGTVTSVGGIITIGSAFDNTGDDDTSFTTGIVISGKSTAPAVLNVNGKLDYAGTISAIQSNGVTQYLTLNVAGTLNTVSGATVDVRGIYAIANVTGTLYSEVAFGVCELYVTGTGSVTAADNAYIGVAEKLVSGTAPADVGNATNNTVITVVLDNSATAFVYGNYTAKNINIYTEASGEDLAESTAYYVADKYNDFFLYMTQFGNATAPLDLSAPEFTSYIFIGWYDAVVNGSKLPVSNTAATIENYPAVYGYTEVKTATVTFYPETNGHWVVNGNSVTSGNVQLELDGNTISFEADSGYKFDGAVTILVNGDTMPSNYQPKSGDVITVTANIVKDEKTGGMDLVTILLIIITIVIIIMAIIIALKLMRS